MRWLVFFLAFASVAVLQLGLGGARLGFSLPGYALLALTSLAAIAFVRHAGSPTDRAAIIAGVGFFLYVAVRAWISPVPWLALSDLWTALGALAGYLVIACHLTDPRERLALVFALLALAMFNLVVGARQFAVGDDFMLFGWLRSEDYRGRASGFFICPNHLAGFLNVTGLFALAAATWARVPAWTRLLLSFGALVCLAGLILTGSRGGLLSLAAGLAVTIWLTFRRLRLARGTSPWRPALLIASLLAVAVAAILVIGAQSESLRRRATLLLESRQDIRLSLWPAALEQAKVAPVFGTGAGTYLYYGREFRQPGMERDPVHVHNDYLHLVAEYGGVGLLGGLLFLGLHLRAGGRGFARLNLRRLGGGARWPASTALAINMGAIASAVALAVHSVLDFNLHLPANAVLLAMVAGMLAQPSVDLSSTPGPPRRQWPLRLLGAGAAVVLAAVALPRWTGERLAEEARVALRDGDLLSATRLAREGLEAESQNPFLWFYLGEARRRLGEQTKAGPEAARSFALGAADAYQASLFLFPRDSRTLIVLAWIWSVLGRTAEADATFIEALEIDPRHAALHVIFAHHLRRGGRLDEARREYQRALDLAGLPAAQQALDELARAGGR